MSTIETNPKHIDLRNSTLTPVFFDRPFTNPETIVAYPHLSAWLETFGEIKVEVPRDVLLLYKEAPYRKGEVETMRREAGLVALSSLIIASKLGISTTNELGQPISDKMSRIIAGKKVTDDEKLDTEDTIGRTEAGTFIQEGLGFLAAVDRLKKHPDSFPLRRIIKNHLSDKRDDDFYDYEHNLGSLIKRNNIGLSGGLALFGLALPKSSFIDNRARSRFGQVVATDPTAQRIYKSLKDIVFDGRSAYIDDELAELTGGEQSLLRGDTIDTFEYFGGFQGFRGVEPKERSKPMGEKELLEEVTDQFLARHK